jgi:hypothetical protein
MAGIKIRIACQFVIIRLFKTLIGSRGGGEWEMWKLCLSQKKIRPSELFERIILRRIFGPAIERERDRDSGMW